jgi:hypothetical protein
MAKTDLFPTFSTTAEEAGKHGSQFDTSFGFLQVPAEVKGVGEATKLPRDIGINLKLKSLGREQEQVEDEDAPQDATSKLRKSMAAAGGIASNPANIFGLRQPTTMDANALTSLSGDPRSFTTMGTPAALADTGYDAFAMLMGEDRELGPTGPSELEQNLQKAQYAGEIGLDITGYSKEEALDELMKYSTDSTTTSGSTISTSSDPRGIQPVPVGLDPATAGAGLNAAGMPMYGSTLGASASTMLGSVAYDPRPILSKGYGTPQMNKMGQGPWYNPNQMSGSAYAMAGAATIGSAYTAYGSLKGGFEGINSPMDGLTATSGVLGTLAGLQTMGLMGGKFFASLMGGPVGWAIGGALLLGSLFGKGGPFGGGKEKPPMGGAEFRVTSTDILDKYNGSPPVDGSDQAAWLYPGSDAYEQAKTDGKLRIVAPYAWGYNGFDSGQAKRHAQDKVDYLYAFADNFKLDVNADTFYKAALGTGGFEKYKPVGDRAPGTKHSVLERIDSVGNGSTSAGAWLREVMEYQGANGERILEGDIYKGVRIDPNTGMPTKVGYADQESFQEAVEKFNQEYYG